MLRGLELVFWVATTGAPAEAFDPAEAPAIEIEWPQREGCPSADSVRADIEERLGRPLDAVEGRRIRATAELSSTPGGWSLELRLEQDGVVGTRSLRGESCELLARATALLLALAIDPLAAARTEAASEEPPVVEAAPPLPERVAPEEVPRSEASPTDRIPVEPRPPVAPSVAVEPPQGVVSPGAVLEAGMLPGVGVGVQLAAGIRVRRFGAGVEGRFFPPRRRALPHDTSSGVRVGGWSVALRGCYRPAPAPRIELPLCADVEAGRMFGRGYGVQQARTEASTWAAAGPAGGIAWVPLRWLAVELDLAAMVRITRIVFALENAGDVHRPAPLSLRIGLGVAFRFP